MSLTVISSCYGFYDDLWVPPDVPGVDDWIMVTDGPYWPGWTCVYEPRPHVHPNVAAKVAKACPSTYTRADKTLWIDAGSTPQATLAAEVEPLLTYPTWAMYPHPERTELHAEVAASRGLPKYDPLPLEAQADAYLADGYPNMALWATGIIGRWNTPENEQVGMAWLAHIVRFGFQDQLSFAYIAWKYNLLIRPIGDGDLWSSPHIQFANHAVKPW